MAILSYYYAKKQGLHQVTEWLPLEGEPIRCQAGDLIPIAWAVYEAKRIGGFVIRSVDKSSIAVFLHPSVAVHRSRNA